MNKQGQSASLSFQLEQKGEYKPASIKEMIGKEPDEAVRKEYLELNEQFPETFPKLYQIKKGIDGNLPEGYVSYIKEGKVWVRDGKKGGYCFLPDNKALIYNSERDISADDIRMFSKIIKDSGITYEESKVLKAIEKAKAPKTQTPNQTQSQAAQEETRKKTAAVMARINTLRGNSDVSEGKLTAIRDQAEALGTEGAQVVDAVEKMLAIVRMSRKEGRGKDKGYEFGKGFFEKLPSFKLYAEDAKLSDDPIAKITIDQKGGKNDFSYETDGKGGPLPDDAIVLICDTMAACGYTMVDIRDVPKANKDQEKFMHALVRRGIVPTGLSLGHSEAISLLAEAEKAIGKNPDVYEAFKKRFNSMMKYTPAGALSAEEMEVKKKDGKDNEEGGGKNNKMPSQMKNRGGKDPR